MNAQEIRSALLSEFNHYDDLLKRLGLSPPIYAPQRVSRLRRHRQPRAEGAQLRHHTTPTLGFGTVTRVGCGAMQAA